MSEPVVGTPEPDHSGFGTRQEMRAEIVRLRAALEIIASKTYPATYVGINEYGVSVYGSYDDASNFARRALEEK